MSTELYYFTGTGNSLYICKVLKENLEKNENETVNIIPISKLDLSKSITTSAKRVGVIFPTYDLDAPKIVKKFVNVLKTDMNSYVFIYTNSGGDSGNSVHSLKSILDSNQITVSNAFSAIYPDNSIIITTKPDEVKKRLTQTDLELVKVSNTIYKYEKEADNKLFHFNKKSYVMGKIFDVALDKYYKITKIGSDDSCTGCTLCTKICPVSNIEMKDNVPLFSDKCEKCLGCIHACPTKSLRFKRMPKKPNFQYRHPKIKLKELTNE